jgi:hypothetical protein
MKVAMALALLSGLLVNLHVHARDAQVARPHWIILMTITDRTTGALLERRELDSDLEFDDPHECKSIVAKAGPIPASDHFSAVLTCHKVERKEAAL